MATNTMLQWEAQITDSQDREAILANIDLLEGFAHAIKGDETLHSHFEEIRKGIKNGSLKPTEWKKSESFGKITTALKSASSGKLTTLTEQSEALTEQSEVLKKGLAGKLSSGDFNSFKTNEFKEAVTSINSHTETLESHTKELDKKLSTSTFNNFKTTELKTVLDNRLKPFAYSSELENIRTLLNKEVSHWTAERTPAPTEYTAENNVKASIQPWGQNEDPKPHTNDLCTVIGDKATDKGVSYRFVKHPTQDTYKWLKVIDNDGAKALSELKKFQVDDGQRYEVIRDAIEEEKRKREQEVKGVKGVSEAHEVELDKLNKLLDKERRNAEERAKQWKVVVTTKGHIKDGVIVNGDMDGGTPVIVHTAHVYDHFGKPKITEAQGKLTWVVNKGRKTTPTERKVTGLVCKVSQKDFVADGTNPHYYNVELTSNF